jgi:tetratricopeptide (TPR) repeat protein
MSMSYVREHKGEGTRRTVLGSEAELMDIVVAAYSGTYYTIVREPHAVLVVMKSGETFLGIHAYYFHPSQTNDQTEVEVLIPNQYNLSDVNSSRQSEKSYMDIFLMRIEPLKRKIMKIKQIEAEKVTDARFQEALRANQAAPVRFVMPEAARRFMVQAEDAVREKKFDDAADLYKQALDVAPLWPEGHFNRALVLGETGSYASAVSEMKRYLLLVPNASNARAAQDKIYVWERKTGEGN